MLGMGKCSSCWWKTSLRRWKWWHRRSRRSCPQEWEEKLEEQGQEHPKTGASSDQPPLEVLEALAAL